MAHLQQAQEGDLAARDAAFDAHMAFTEIVGPANATIDVTLTLANPVPSSVHTNVYLLAAGAMGSLYWTVSGPALHCVVPCSDGTTVLTISSPGTGHLSVGNPVTVEFAGEGEAATINLLGFEVDGFTLDGELGGGAGFL